MGTLPVDHSPGIVCVRVTFAEYKVLKELIRDGATNKVIARRCYLTEDTVKTHIKSILARTPQTDRTSLVVAVLRGKTQIHPVHRTAGARPSQPTRPVGLHPQRRGLQLALPHVNQERLSRDLGLSPVPEVLPVAVAASCLA